MENPFEILNDIRAEQAMLRILIEQLLSPVTSSSEPLLTQKEACEWARMSEATWIKWRNKGKIPYKQIGGRYLYDKQEVLVVISKLKGGSK
jgi:hypothetical protein